MKKFVEGILSEVIADAAGYIDHLEYFTDGTDESHVDIVCNNGYRYYVNTSMDSKLGIINDVMREVNKH